MGVEKELGFESQLIAGELESLFQTVGGVARGMQGAAETEDEGDAGVAWWIFRGRRHYR